MLRKGVAWKKRKRGEVGDREYWLYLTAAISTTYECGENGGSNVGHQSIVDGIGKKRRRNGMEWRRGYEKRKRRREIRYADRLDMANGNGGKMSRKARFHLQNLGWKSVLHFREKSFCFVTFVFFFWHEMVPSWRAHGNKFNFRHLYASRIP